MRTKIILIIILASTVLILLPQASDRFQSGAKFGVVGNSFTSFPDGVNNPFQEMDIHSRPGLVAGVFYEYQIFSNKPYLFVCFGGSYKLLYFKGYFTTTDAEPVTGDVRQFFHVIDVPIGMKVIHPTMNGHPFFGIGLEMDVIVADSHLINFDQELAPEQEQDYDIVKEYKNRHNLGLYFCSGFEIKGKSFSYVFEFRYIRWALDNFTDDTSFFSRSKNEVQLTFGIKLR